MAKQPSGKIVRLNVGGVSVSCSGMILMIAQSISSLSGSLVRNCILAGLYLGLWGSGYARLAEERMNCVNIMGAK